MSTSISLMISNLPPKEAQSIASTLVTERLAACVTLTPVQSVYRWAGEICIDEEVTLTAKVSTSIIDSCVERLKNLHPYELPEIIVIPVDPERSLPAYLQWVTRECQS
jgi:periplasmic divalent cation tolerance protein